MKLSTLIRDGRLKAVADAIDRGAQLDTPDHFGFTPLMIACRAGQWRIAELLIERGARLDVAAAGGETALSLAMVHCWSIAELLVERGVLGRPLRVPAEGELLSPDDCDVCTRYSDRIEVDDRWSETPADLAWLEVVREERSSEGKTDYVERGLRCPFCGTRYEQFFAYEVETAGVTLPSVSQWIRKSA